MEKKAIKRGLLTVPTLSKDEMKKLVMRNPVRDTMNRFAPMYAKVPEYLFAFKEVIGGYLVPRNFPTEYEITDLTHEGSPIKGETSIKLRDEQQRYIKNSVFPELSKTTDVTLNVPTGKGKTVMAIYLIHHLKLSALVVVPTKQLGNQFIERVKQFSTYTAGWLGTKKIRQHDITIVTYNLLAGFWGTTRKYNPFPESFYKDYGVIIFDEYHKAGSEKFIVINEKAVSKHRITLTATFRRADGLEKFLQYHAGKQLKMETRRNTAIVQPLIINVPYDIDEFKPFSSRSTSIKKLDLNDKVLLKNEEETHIGRVLEIHLTQPPFINVLAEQNIINSQGYKVYKKAADISYTSIISWIAENEEILNIYHRLVLQSYENGRNILLISKRKTFLFAMFEKLKHLETGVLMSDKDASFKKFCAEEGRTTKQNEAYCIKEARIILAIDKLSEFGLDIERLDTLYIVHPLKDVEQALGRITRDYTNKKRPVCYYPLYNLPMCMHAYTSQKGAKYWFEKLSTIILKEKTPEGVNRYLITTNKSY